MRGVYKLLIWLSSAAAQSYGETIPGRPTILKVKLFSHSRRYFHAQNSNVAHFMGRINAAINRRMASVGLQTGQCRTFYKMNKDRSNRGLIASFHAYYFHQSHNDVVWVIDWQYYAPLYSEYVYVIYIVYLMKTVNSSNYDLVLFYIP